MTCAFHELRIVTDLWGCFYVFSCAVYLQKVSVAQEKDHIFHARTPEHAVAAQLATETSSAVT
jgi:hypothetical protein